MRICRTTRSCTVHLTGYAVCSTFGRDVQSLSQVLQRAEWVYQSTPAFRLDSDIVCSTAPSLRGRYPASSLLRAEPPPSRLQSISRVSGYTTYLAPPLARWDEDGFSSCSPCPCHRATPNHPAGVTHRFGQRAACHAAFAQTRRARPPEPSSVEATTGFTCVAAR